MKRTTEFNYREVPPFAVTGLVLCGGKSRRMGRDKAFLPYGETTMVAHVLSTISDLFEEVFLVANEPEFYENLGVDVVKDILPHRGPLGGILSGLLVSENSYVFVIACDMPLVGRKLIRDMTLQRHANDVIVLAHEHGIEPLLGLYSKKCIKPIEESLFTGDLSVQEVLSGLKAKTFDYKSNDVEILPQYFDVNTPQDYSKLDIKADTHSRLVGKDRAR